MAKLILDEVAKAHAGEYRSKEITADTPDAEVEDWLFGDHGTQAARLDIDWSDCPLVHRHPDFLGGALAMRHRPRMPVEALIVNYNGGHSIEDVAAMYELPIDEVREIIQYALERS